MFYWEFVVVIGVLEKGNYLDFIIDMGVFVVLCIKYFILNFVCSFLVVGVLERKIR